MGTPFNFRSASLEALDNASLQSALHVMKRGFVDKRAKAKAALPEFEVLRLQAENVRNHVLDNLDAYLLRYESQVEAHGGHVHWASDSSSACRAVLEICHRHNAKTVTKSKSMIGEEIGINAALESAKIQPIETDLGEYIIQLRKERPSHIIAPALHVLKEDVAKDFRRHHKHLPKKRTLTENQDLVKEARSVLRSKYFTADIGITGANFLLADTGTSVVVTNEGNADLTTLLPKVHIVLASIDKVVPNFNDVMGLLRLLARSATGQEISTYTSFSTGPKRAHELDGAEEYHVILLDNGRSALLDTDKRDILRCIRCGACMNHCPVYSSIGGHAYGAVYAGPIGSALSPALDGLSARRDLPHASSFCGRCEEVCPVRIPLTSIMRSWRHDDFTARTTFGKLAMRSWAWFASHWVMYRCLVSVAVWLLRVLPLRTFGLASFWTGSRSFLRPSSRRSFMSHYFGGQK